MRRYTGVTEQTKRTAAIICNRCGKEIHPENGIWTEDVLHIEKTWGYFSRKDSRSDCFDLCESCYDEIIKAFAVPVETKEL